MAVPGKKTSKSFSATTFKASEEDLQVYCQPCDNEGPRLPAHGYCTDCKEHLCENCFTVHKKHKLSKHHTLLEASSMPKSLQQPTSSQTSQSDDLTTPCVRHPKEMIKFFCNDHEELLCSVCVTLEHQSISCKVNYIPDISGDIIDSVDYQVILHAVNNLADQYKKIEEDVKKLTSTSNSSLQNVLADIKKYRHEINKRLDELERQFEDAAKAIMQDNNKNLTTVETTFEDITKSLKTSSDIIKKLNTSKSKQADKLFIELKLVEKKMKDAEKNTHQLKSYDLKEYNFTPDDAILTQLKTEISLGTLSPKSLNKKSASKTEQVKSRKFKHQGELYVKTSRDKDKCWITGMTILLPDHLVIADHNNKALKMVDTRSQSVTDQLQLPEEPWDITTVTSTGLAVTLSDIEIIQFISVSSNKLTMKHTMKVGGVCYGISYHQGKLVVSICNPAKFQIFDINGKILREINGGKNFHFQSYVTSNSSSIYVSYKLMNTLTRLNWQGEVIRSYGGMAGPRGIALSDDGTVFACDTERNVIEEISGDCSTGKTMLMNLNRPYAVCWCKETKMLYNSCYTGDDRNNFLHIYELS